MYEVCPFCNQDIEIIIVNDEIDRYVCPTCGILEICPKCRGLVRILRLPETKILWKECNICGAIPIL